MTHKDYQPTIAQVRTFATIAEHGHFGTAAAHLGISQPSLSQALATLEQGLGVQLIERSTRKVIVTPMGRSLLPFAHATLESVDALVDHANSVKGGLGSALVVGMIPTIAPFLLPDFLRALDEPQARDAPRIVEEKTHHLVDALRQGRIDVAVLGLPFEDAGLTTIPLYEEEFVVVVPEGHPMAGRRDLRVADLEKLDLLLLDEGHCLRDQVMDLCRRVNMSHDPRLAVTRATSLSTVVHLVAAGQGATLVPLSAVPSECQRPGIGLATFHPEEKAAGRTVGIAHRSSSVRTEDYEELGRILSESFAAVQETARVELAASLGE